MKSLHSHFYLKSINPIVCGHESFEGGPNRCPHCSTITMLARSGWNALHVSSGTVVKILSLLDQSVGLTHYYAFFQIFSFHKLGNIKYF